MAVNGKILTGDDLKSFYATAQKSAAQGGLRTEIESGTEAPAVLMPGSPLKALQDAIEQTVKTATDMQKKKEDRIETKNPVDSGQIKKVRSEKQLDEYVKTDAHKKAIDKNDNQQKKLDKIAQSMLTGGMDTYTPEVIQDEAEQRLLAEIRMGEAEHDAFVAKNDQADIEALSAEEQDVLEQYAVNQIRDQNLPVEMVGVMPTARQEAAPLIDKIGQQRVDELAETYMRQQNAELAQQVDQQSREFADKHGVIGSALTVPVAALNGVVGTVGQLQGWARNTGRYSALDPNATGTIGDVFTGAVRGQVAQNIEGENPTLLSKGLSIGYQGLMSAADSIARAYLGRGAFGGSALAATSSFSQTMADAARQGATPAQAALLATATSGIEALTEAMPLDDLIRTAKGGNTTGFIVNVLRQMGIEAATEEASLLGSLIAEAAILQEKSEYNQNVQSLMLLGHTEVEARQMAAEEIINEAINTALVSAVAGFGSGVSAAKANEINLFAEKGAPEAVGIPKKKEVVTSKQEIFKKYGRDPQTGEKLVQEIIEGFGAEQAQNMPQQPVSAPLTEEQQNMANATNAVNGVEVQKNATETGGIWNKLRGYTQRERDNWKSSKRIVLCDSVEHFKQFVTDALTSKGQTHKKMYFGAISPDLAAEIANATGVNVEGYNLSLGEDEVRKINKSHGNENKESLRGQRAVTEADYLSIPDIVQNADSIKRSDSDYEGKPAIEFQKRNGNEITTVVAVVSDKRLDVFVQTAYINKKSGSIATPEPVQADSFTPVATGGTAPNSEAVQAGHDGTFANASANIVPETTQEVNNNPATESYDNASAQSTPVTDIPKQSTEEGQHQESKDASSEMQRDRINSVRDQAIPKTDPDSKVVSEAAGNIYTSSRTPDSFAENIRRLVNEGRVSHDVQTNEESLNKAAASIAEDGSIQNALKKIQEVANSGRTGVVDVAKGVLIYDELVNSSDSTHQALAEECFVTLSQLATNTGRPMQLYSLFRKMSPESQVRTLEQEVQRNVEKMQKAGTVKKDYRPSIDPKLSDLYREAAVEYQKASGAEAKQAAEQKMQDVQNIIYAEEAAKLPTTFKAKWDAWRYMAMLGNAKTQIRNLVGNTLMLPYTDAKRAVGAILEKGISTDQRTKAVFVDRQLMNWAKQDTANVRAVLEGSAKLGDSNTRNPLAEGAKTFGDSWLGERFNDMQSIIDKAVSGGDMLFKNGEYARSLAGFLKARGYTAKDVQTDGGIPVDVLNEARNYAVNEALKATFNDTNMLSDALANGLRYKGDNPVMKAINLLGEGIMPFRKTPANVVMRFKDYSPAGLAQGVWNMAANVRNGKVSAATAIDQIASGITGTVLMQLGYVLAGGIAGVKITGSGSDEDEKRQGHQNYALEFSVNGQEYSYTIDWASPANLPLFLGANIRAMQEAPDTASFLTATTNAARGALEPLLQLSCLSSLNDMFESARYADEGEAIYTFLARGATNYLTQGIPSLARQVTQARTENKQTTFVASDDPVIGDVQKAVAGLGVGNPYKTDKRNAWGEKEQMGEGLSSLTGMPSELARAIDALFNPGTLKKIDNSAAELEISRLNKAGYNVTPNTAARTVSYIDKDGTGHDDVRLTEEQFQKLAETQGQTARKLVEDMISSASYAALTDEQKADAIDTAYLYARKTGEIAAIEDHTGYDQSWFYDVEKGGAEEIIRRVLNSGLNTSMSDLDTAWDRGYNEETFNRELETAYESYRNAPADMRKQVYAEAEGTTKKYIEARDKGVSHEDFVAAAENIAKVKGTGSINKDTGKATVRDIDRRQAIANTSGMTPHEIDIVMKAYMADYDPSDESPETTEMKYDYIRHEMGMSAKEYAATYRAYLDSSKKAQRIAAIRALGYDYGTALKLYKVYSGSMKKKLIDMYG